MSDSPTYRQWHILQTIPREPERIDVNRLYEILTGFYNLEIKHKRYIQRDLDQLQHLFPMLTNDYLDNGNADRPYKWYWKRNTNISIPGMDSQTAIMFTLLWKIVPEILPPSTKTYLEPYLMTAEKVLGLKETKKLKEWVDKVQIHSRGIPFYKTPEVNPDVLESVYKALFHDKQISLFYKSRTRDSYEPRIVNPLGIVYREPLFYLICTTQNETKVIQRLLHRMKEVEVLESEVIKPDDFDLNTYISDGAFDYPRDEAAWFDLKIIAKPEIAVYFHEAAIGLNQKTTTHDDCSVLVEAKVLDSTALRRWLFGFGHNIKILEPESLKNEYLESIQTILSMYE